MNFRLFTHKKHLALGLAAGLGAALLLSCAGLAGDKGMLRIVTEPGDAKILINGKQKGNSPSEPGQSFAIKLDEGEYQVQAIKSSGGPKEQFAEKKVFVADETMQTITLKLEERASAEFAKAMAGYIPNPEMVSIQAGSFTMGCQGNDKNCDDDEKPAREVSLSAFAIGKYEVTFEMWDACFAQGGCDKSPDDQGWGRGTRPVINVSWDDIQKFLVWMKAKTGKSYRLPTEAEWECAARAGSKTVYSWGDEVGKNKANCNGCGIHLDNKQTAPVGSFAANPWGLYDMHGNVQEWCSDWYANDYYQKSPGQNPQGPLSGSYRVLRGGSWYSSPRNLRAAFREYNSPGYALINLGFRLVLPSSASGK